jgi:2-amino-4-hydroxy-6-hydroxymethyldihydropteridine diphosphokinase
MNHRIFLSLGTNLGDRALNLKLAREGIEQRIGKIIATSSLYQTEAWGKNDQPDFYNQVLEINSLLEPETLLGELLRLEETMGRVRTEKWGTRIIDIDILLYGGQIVNTQHLTIPHPGIEHRNFVLIPLAEIAPAMLHPIHKKTIADLLMICTDPLIVKKLES